MIFRTQWNHGTIFVNNRIELIGRKVITFTRAIQISLSLVSSSLEVKVAVL